MAVWKITISGKGVRQATVDKLAETYREKFGEDVSISVVDASPPESRAERFSDAMSSVSDARSQCEELRDEMQDWYDSIPENLQSGSKAEEVQETIDNLENVIGELEDIEGSDVSFPSMM